MRVEFDGQDYELDLDEMDYREAKYIKSKTGFTLMDLQEGLNKVDPDALGALFWIMNKQAGKAMDIDGINFKAVKFANAIIEAQIREAAELGEDEEASDPKDES